MKQLSLAIALAILGTVGCGRSSNTRTAPTFRMTGVNAASYTPKTGIAVSTNSRTCVAIPNGNLTNGTAITLISPMPPVMFSQATIAGIAQQACPISQNVDTTVSNYNLTPQGPVQKLTPMIAVLGTPVLTVNGNNVGQADLDQNGQTETFRACSADDGIHLSIWNGSPLSGTLLWHGHYYESSNPGIGPSCTPAEMPVS